MEELQVAEEMMAMLQQDPLVAEYFETNIQWLKDRVELWNSQYIRIGLVGVTSSGKSTLLNALLEDSILPAAVRPSSGTLITCVKGQELQATFYFSDGSPPRKKSGSNLATEIRKYADEKENPNNEKNIRFIAIESPDYLLDADMQIVDSPGLDADGYDSHEALTMEELLPTVDLCLYVVTMKANSDHTTYRVIESIRHHHKPLIIVQNMLDSVERKIGSGGVVLKTKEEVAMEHQSRVQRIVSKVNPVLQSLVDVVQVSAKQALQSRKQHADPLWQQSQLDSLIETIRYNVDRIRPQIKRNRLLQLYRHFSDMVADESLHSEDDTQDVGQDLIPLVLAPHLEKSDEIRREFDSAKQGTQALLTHIGLTYERAIANLGSLATDKVHEAEKRIDDVKNQVQSLEQQLVQGLRTFHRSISEVLTALNLNPSDYIGSDIPNPRASASTFQVKKRVMQRTVKREKSGFGGWVGRLIRYDKWGYEEKEIEYEVFDLSAIRSSLMLHHEKTMDAINEFLYQWEQRMDHLQEIVNQEVDRRVREVTNKRERRLAKKNAQYLVIAFQEWITVMGEHLGVQEAAPAQETAVRPKEAAAPALHLQQMEISRSMHSLHQLSHRLLSMQFHHIWHYCQSENAKCGREVPATLIWGWDEFSLLQFARRFLPVQIPDSLPQLVQSGYVWIDHGQHRYVLVNELGFTSQSAPELSLMLEHRPYHTYVMVNAIQEGAAKKQLKNSLLHRMPHSQAAIVNLVCQSLEEFKTGQNLQEGIFSLHHVQAEISEPRRGQLLLNDSNPIYSLLICELSRRHDLTIADESVIMAQLRQLFPYLLLHDSSRLCTQILRAYSEIQKVKVVRET